MVHDGGKSQNMGEKVIWYVWRVGWGWGGEAVCCVCRWHLCHRMKWSAVKRLIPLGYISSVISTKSDCWATKQFAPPPSFSQPQCLLCVPHCYFSPSLHVLASCLKLMVLSCFRCTCCTSCRLSLSVWGLRFDPTSLPWCSTCPCCGKSLRSTTCCAVPSSPPSFIWCR